MIIRRSNISCIFLISKIILKSRICKIRTNLFIILS
nr:MAG TPA: hypothetical protein [Caudoviricetes sp.]